MASSEVQSARERLINAAERLIAEHGPAVSVRQIGVAAGQRNNGAVQYHFGGRDQLIASIVDARQGPLDRARLERIRADEASGRDDLGALVEALLAPVFELQREAEESFHARFLEKIWDHAGFPSVEDGRWPATSLILDRMQRMLDGMIPHELQRHRVRAMTAATFALMADLERSGLSGQDRLDAEKNVLLMVEGMLRAPGWTSPPPGVRRPPGAG